jgi:hypothetical protein
VRSFSAMRREFSSMRGVSVSPAPLCARSCRFFSSWRDASAKG